MSRPRSAEWPPSPRSPPADLPDRPPRTKCDELAGLLHEQAPGLRVVHPDRSAFCYVIDADVDPATLGELLPLEDYGDCWRGAVQCVADAPPNYGDGPGRAVVLFP